MMFLYVDLYILPARKDLAGKKCDYWKSTVI